MEAELSAGTRCRGAAIHQLRGLSKIYIFVCAVFVWILVFIGCWGVVRWVVPGIYTICGIYSILMTDRYYTEGKQNILHVYALFLLVQNWVGDMIGGAVFPA